MQDRRGGEVTKEIVPQMTGLREKRGRYKIYRPTDDRCKREDEDERRNKRDSPTDDRCKREEEEKE